MALSRAKNMTRIFPPTVLALKGSFCVLKDRPCLSHFSAGRRLDLYRLLLVIIPMASPAPLALFPALLPRSPLGSRPSGPVSRTSSALAAWFYMGSCLCPYGFSWPCFPHFFRARRLDPHGLLFGSLLWFLLPHRPSFPHFFRGRRFDPYGFLLRSLWLLPLHWPCFTHFFRGRRQDPLVA